MENGWELTSELTSKWITLKVLIQASPNLKRSCRNTRRWRLQNYMENGLELTSELTSKWITFKNTESNFTLISLITFEVLNQTLSNLQGICRNSSVWCMQNYITLISLITFEVLNQTLSNLQGICRNSSVWCMQNYMENGWELMSELTFKWITFKVLNQTLPNW